MNNLRRKPLVNNNTCERRRNKAYRRRCDKPTTARTAARGWGLLCRAPQLVISCNSIRGTVECVVDCTSLLFCILRHVSIHCFVNCFQLIPTNAALSSMPYFFYYSLLGRDVTTCTFEDLLNPLFHPQQASVRLSCKPDVVRQFLVVQKPLQVSRLYLTIVAV